MDYFKDIDELKEKYLSNKASIIEEKLIQALKEEKKFAEVFFDVPKVLLNELREKGYSLKFSKNVTRIEFPDLNKESKGDDDVE